MLYKLNITIPCDLPQCLEIVISYFGEFLNISLFFTFSKYQMMAQQQQFQRRKVEKTLSYLDVKLQFLYNRTSTMTFLISWKNSSLNRQHSPARLATVSINEQKQREVTWFLVNLQNSAKTMSLFCRCLHNQSCFATFSINTQKLS